MPDISTTQLSEKIQSLESWEWYFNEKKYADFYDYFKKENPDIDIDSSTLRKIGLALIKGEKITQDIKAVIQGRNVAFKCNFNDADFKGRCSKKLCEYNWKYGGDWCKQPTNPCWNEEKHPCMESELWIDYTFGPGNYHTKDKYDDPKPLRYVKVGKVALMTTLEPTKNNEGEYISNGDQTDRYIFGILDIIKFDDGRSIKDTQEDNAFIFGDKQNSIIIDKSIKLKLFDYYSNPNAPEVKKWSSLLFRYITDDTVYQILIDLKKIYIKKDLNKKEIEKIDRLIQRYEKWI